MKTYLLINVESSINELVVKIEPLYCTNGRDENIMTIKNDDYFPTKGDKLYFLPGINVPRVKLKDLSLQYGIKSVRDIDQATHVFGSKNTKAKITSGEWYYSMATSNLQEIYDNSENVMDSYYRENIRQALEFYTEHIVLMKSSSASDIRNSQLSILNNLSNPTRNSDVYYTVDKDYVELFPKITTLEIFNESKLLKYINGEDATVIDGVMFVQLCDMFESSDQDNHIIAMEIMANSNYIDSLLYIEMLFEKHARKMADCHTKNHVNFKSLISFLGKDKSYLGTSIDEVVESLIAKDVFDLEKVEAIMKHYGQEIADSGGTKYFEVKSVTLSEDAAKLLNTNYVHETFPDFIPEVQENLEDLNNSLGVAGVATDIEISDEDIETAFTRIERNELKSELIALEEANLVSESELNEKSTEGTLEENESNNNQIKETNDTDSFEWF
jgi:hypothetical protein